MKSFYPKESDGFSMMELVAAMLIISILAVVVNTRLPTTGLNLSAQADQLAADLRFTQALSMTQAQRHCLVFSTTSYQVVNSATTTALILGGGSATLTLGSGMSFGTRVPAGLMMVVFDSMGIPYSSSSTTCTSVNANAATALTSAASIPLSGSGQTKTIGISPETGRVNIQ